MKMLRSKSSRSGFADFGHRSQPSVLSRTLSASRFCRGDALASQIDSKALKPVGRNSLDRKPSRTLNLTESQINKVLAMQEHMGQIEEELKWAKERLVVVEGEKNKAIDESREIKREAMLLSPKKTGELLKEIKNLKEVLCSAQNELITKDKEIISLEIKVDQAKQFEIKLAETEVSLNKLKEELNNRTKSSEDELQKLKESEAKLMDSLASLAKQMEQTKIELEESKLQIASPQVENGSLKYKAEVNAEQAQPDNNKHSIMIDDLRNELRLSLEAEEKSKKAMDDLAMALKEVASEANRANQKVNSTQLELEEIKEEAEKLKVMIRGNEEKYEKLLEEARKEAEVHQNTADRLRSEAEESLLAWNGKETCFVGCIKKAEEEKAHVQYENARLVESLKVAERVAMTSREESFKVRDILKQALSEANASKAASEIAKDENSQLKDSLSEKDEAIHFLTRENERLRLSEVAAYENLKEFKTLLAAASTKLKLVKDDHSSDNLTAEEREDEEEGDEEEEEEEEDDELLEQEQEQEQKHEEEQYQRVEVDQRLLSRKNFSFNLSEYENLDEDSEELDPEKAEALKGSIFDAGADSPRSEPKTPKGGQQQQQQQYQYQHHRRESSSFYTVDGETLSPDDLEHYEDAENNSNSNSSSSSSSCNNNNHKRRKGALFRRVGDLIMRKSFHRKEPSTTPTPLTSPSTPPVVHQHLSSLAG